MVETDEQALERGRKRILAVQKDRVKRGRITAGAMDALMSNLTFTLVGVGISANTERSHATQPLPPSPPPPPSIP